MADDTDVRSSVWEESLLVEPDWICDQIKRNCSDLAIVDMRGHVRTKTDEAGVQTAEYIGARDEYLQAHIPGAVYIDWTTDIVDTLDPVPAQVAKGRQISELFSRLGIGKSTWIVAYDAHPAMQFATRLWWVCRYFGCDNVRVLNGGWLRWLEEGRPVTTDIPERDPRRTFTALANSKWIASTSDVMKVIGRQNVCIIDARDADQFSGRVRRGKRGGHIPGAIHLPREAIFDSPGQLKGPAALREVISAAGIPVDEHNTTMDEHRIIAYCNGGVAATSVLFALSMLGYSNLSNYDGSWNEWNLDDSLPVETA